MNFEILPEEERIDNMDLESLSKEELVFFLGRYKEALTKAEEKIEAKSHYLKIANSLRECFKKDFESYMKNQKTRLPGYYQVKLNGQWHVGWLKDDGTWSLRKDQEVYFNKDFEEIRSEKLINQEFVIGDRVRIKTHVPFYAQIFWEVDREFLGMEAEVVGMLDEVDDAVLLDVDNRKQPWSNHMIIKI